MASSDPTPVAAGRPGSSPGPQDLAVLGTALELGREADTERQTARASAGAVDDVSTPHVDEQREGLIDAQQHVDHAGADQATSTALLSQASAGAPATAAQSYPTPIKEVSATQAAPKTTVNASATRTAARRAPTAGRRR